MAIQMTKEQYQQKYGQAPAVQPSQQPIKMTKAEYASKYGEHPAAPTPQQPSQQPIINPMGSFMSGLGKSAIGLVGGLEQLGEKMFNPIVEKVTGSKIDTGNIPKIVEDAASPTNAIESAGKTAGDIGQFFLPGGVVTKGAKIADAGIEAAKLPSIIEGGAKLLSKMGLGAAEVGGVTAAQTGSPEEGKKAAELGAILPIVGAIGGKMMQGAGEFARNLEKTSLRLTPVQKSKLGAKVGEVADYMVNNKIIGSPEVRYNKIVDVYKGMEDTFQSFLGKEAKNVSTKTEDILKNLESLKSTLGADNLNAPAIEKKIDSTIEFLKSKYGESIPVSALNKLKRSAYEATYNESGMKVLDPTMQHVGEVLKTSIEKATEGMKIMGKDIAGFNKEYGTIINAKKLLNIAKGRPEIGLVGKLVSTFVGSGIGELVGGPIGAAAGAIGGSKIGETVAGTAARSTVGAALDYLSKLGRVTEEEAGTIKDFILGGGKGITLTPKEEAVAKKITEGIQSGKGLPAGMSVKDISKVDGKSIPNILGKIDKEDGKIMTDFIDNIRLKSGENVDLEIKARKMAESMGLDANVTNAQLAKKFDEIMSYNFKAKPKSFVKKIS